MDSSQVVTVLVAVIAAVGTTLVTGLMARPKTKAEAKATDAAGQVNVSSDAREWVKEFRDAAMKAEARANEADKRCDDIEAEFAQFKAAVAAHVGALRQDIRDLGGHPRPAPAELIPPL